ncbi:hypothetical protein C8J57DRAFT_1249477 [Mycena rebaudengoi]|nr:hypothetical protein C8J57DRAFT_1249477 [Mycena rebaudengoi]
MYLKYTCLQLEKEKLAPTPACEGNKLIALVDPPIGYSWDNLYDGSIWFKLLSQFGFQSEVVDDQLLPTLTRHARESRWQNLLSLYMQLMAHFEIKLAAPTMEFKVPLLNLIAHKDTGAEPKKAIICQKLTDKEQSALKLEEVYQQNEEDKKDFIKLEAEMCQGHSELDQMTEEEEDEVQWDAVKGSSLSEGEGEVMPDQ